MGGMEKTVECKYEGVDDDGEGLRPDGHLKIARGLKEYVNWTSWPVASPFGDVKANVGPSQSSMQYRHYCRCVEGIAGEIFEVFTERWCERPRVLLSRDCVVAPLSQREAQIADQSQVFGTRTIAVEYVWVDGSGYVGRVDVPGGHHAKTAGVWRVAVVWPVCVVSGVWR